MKSAIQRKVAARCRCLVVMAGLVAGAAAAAAPGETSANADSVYAAARPALIQVRTLVQSADRQSTLGSGFLVSADGLAVTNYHVVSQYALEPGTYRMEYAAPDGSHGSLKLLAVDVANDLAVVRLEGQKLPYLGFDAEALGAGLPKGERLYAMGNPLDLGFTIVEGTYNGPVERSYNDRIHFTGAMNPGMSGGPAVTTAGRVAGINVAKRLDGELVSFLVPARFAAALVERARGAAPLQLDHAREEIGRQLALRQDALYQALGKSGFHGVDAGPYRAPESDAPWFTCWAHTNQDDKPKPLAQTDTTSCNADTGLFVAGDLQTGNVTLRHSYSRSLDLNAFQFSSYLSHNYQPTGMRSWVSPKRLTPPRCHDDFIAAPAGLKQPVLRAVWCASAYRDFSGLYDVSVTALTADRNREALVAELDMRGASYDAALGLGRRFLETLTWKP
jgi:serine protease Do